MNHSELTIDVPLEHMENLFGQFDSNIKIIERTLNVSFVARGDTIKLLGAKKDVESASAVVLELLELSKRGTQLTEQEINYALSLSRKELGNHAMADLQQDCICHTITGKPVQPKTIGQKQYVEAIRERMVTFGVGPAGTGKTYLAMAMAITAFQREEVSRIILTRPAIEAGEKLGFLPGDMQSKVDPYLRPLYDALYQIMGADNFLRNMEKGAIEVAPLAYMRGRTLDNAFIILDEAQNTTPSQMKMFLTRVGFGSKTVITGDATQKDLPFGVVSGLDIALRVLERVEEIGICYLTGNDVVRHPLVQKIVHAYEQYEEREQKPENVRKNRSGLKNERKKKK